MPHLTFHWSLFSHIVLSWLVASGLLKSKSTAWFSKSCCITNIHVVGARPHLLLAGFSVSSNESLADTPGANRIWCPSHDKWCRSTVLLHFLTLVMAYRSSFVMIRGYDLRWCGLIYPRKNVWGPLGHSNKNPVHYGTNSPLSITEDWFNDRYQISLRP